VSKNRAEKERQKKLVEMSKPSDVKVKLNEHGEVDINPLPNDNLAP
jgi:hypothetical protein